MFVQLDKQSNRHIPAPQAPVESGSPTSGKVRTGILLWALGIPIPLLLLFLLFRGCA